MNYFQLRKVNQFESESREHSGSGSCADGEALQQAPGCLSTLFWRQTTSIAKSNPGQGTVQCPQNQKTDTEQVSNMSPHNFTPFRSARHFLVQQRRCKLGFVVSTPVPACCLIRVTDFSQITLRSFQENTALPLSPIISNGK